MSAVSSNKYMHTVTGNILTKKN